MLSAFSCKSIEGNPASSRTAGGASVAPLPRSFPGPPRAVRGEIKRVACKYVLFNYGKGKGTRGRNCVSHLIVTVTRQTLQ